MSTNLMSPEDPPTFVFRDDAIQTRIDLRCYRLVAVQKTAYRVADQCTVVLGSPEEHLQPVTFIFPPRTTESVALEAVRLFFQDLLDQELREQVGDETRAIRSLILAHAFSRTDLLRRD